MFDSSTTKAVLKVYWGHAWKYPRYVIGLLLMVPIATIMFRLAPPLIAALILRRLAAGDYTPHDVWGSFGADLLVYAAVTLIGGILAWRIVVFLVWRLEGYVTRDLDRTMFNKFLTLSASFHADNFGGSLVSQTTKLHNSYVRLADTFIFQFYTLLISFVFILLVLHKRAPVFVLALMAFSIVYIFFTIILTRRVRELSTLEAQAHTKATGNLADAITNVLAIKSFSALKSEEERFNETTEDRRRKMMDVMWVSLRRDLFASSVTSSLLVMAVLVSVIVVVVYKANVATVFLMMTYSVAIGDQLWEFSSSTLRNYNRSIGDAQEAVDTLHTKPEVEDPKKPEKLSIRKGSITFKDVGFDHEDGNEEDALFQNFNLEIKDGEKVGLVGHSGGGKTTLTKLILRFMDIDEGEILIDGQNISHITQDDLRSKITYVPQEPLLFHRSLMENIRYGNPTAPDPAVFKVAKAAHAHEFILELPEQYKTLVGERGVKLSGGQRQRVAIARAMLKDAPIILLDEATSALDSESEKLIQEGLWSLMKNKTAIVIAHRLSTIQRMDRIIVLEDGRIIEQGSHKELLKTNGTYAKLWKHQSGGFLES
ncbi:MAG TPA: ABC transporter ATP-binding protein [Candidatus Saccharimonadales bacterium]|nr:ABC transporter ATP-binding protein [Candidatus Saccharimonadales bacterium]